MADMRQSIGESRATIMAILVIILIGEPPQEA